ncbi:MAG: zf-HC2 domain-containing protein [Phycisphaerae bacterium]
MTCGELREYLIAFLDSELDAPLSIEVQRHLEHCALCAREAEIERAIRKQLAETLQIARVPDVQYDEIVNAVSGAESPTPMRASTRRRRRTVLVAAAAVAIAAFAWMQRDAVRMPHDVSFADLVVADFVHFVEEGRPVQLASADSQDVRRWLRERTGLDVTMPSPPADCAALRGARKCKLSGRPAAFASYTIGGVPASLVVTESRGVDIESMARIDTTGGAHWIDRCKGHTVVVRRRGTLLYAAVSTLPEKDLRCLMTDEAYESH